MDVCPTDVILASTERIWRLLTDPHQLARWTGTTLVGGPSRPVSVGDRLVLRAAVFRIIVDVLDISALKQLTLDVALPFGVMNHEQIQITPIDVHSSRVTFN
jgi:hypothetical protein